MGALVSPGEGGASLHKQRRKERLKGKVKRSFPSEPVIEAPRPPRQDGTGTPGLPGNVTSFYIVPLPACRQGPHASRQSGTGHVPIKRGGRLFLLQIQAASFHEIVMVSSILRKGVGSILDIDPFRNIASLNRFRLDSLSDLLG